MDENLALAVNQWINGNEEGFNTIYNETYNYVFAKTRAIMKNYDDAADLLQEVYIAASKSLSTLSDPNNLYAWLGGIAYRQGMKIFNKQRDVLVSDEGEGLFEVQECLDKSVQPGVEMEERETADIIKDMLDELPPEQSAVVVAYYYDEMSVTDIAETLGVSTGTIKSRLNYARKKLQELVIAKEEREGIRLHSVTIPTIIIAVHMYMEGFALDVADAQIVYNGIATKMGYASVVGSQGVGAAYTFDNASNMSSLGSNISNHGGISGAASGSSGMSAAVTSASVSSTVGTSIIKSIAVMIIIIISSTSGVVIGKKAYQKYHDKIEYSSSSSAQGDDTSSANNESNNSQGDNSSGDAASNDALADVVTNEDAHKIYEDALPDMLDKIEGEGYDYYDGYSVFRETLAMTNIDELEGYHAYYSFVDYDDDGIDELVTGGRVFHYMAVPEVWGIYAIDNGSLKTIHEFDYSGKADDNVAENKSDTFEIPAVDNWIGRDGSIVPGDRDGKVLSLSICYCKANKSKVSLRVKGNNIRISGLVEEMVDGSFDNSKEKAIDDVFELDENCIITQTWGATGLNNFFNEYEMSADVDYLHSASSEECFPTLIYIDGNNIVYRIAQHHECHPPY